MSSTTQIPAQYLPRTVEPVRRHLSSTPITSAVALANAQALGAHTRGVPLTETQQAALAGIKAEATPHIGRMASAVMKGDRTEFIYAKGEFELVIAEQTGSRANDAMRNAVTELVVGTDNAEILSTFADLGVAQAASLRSGRMSVTL